MQIPKSFFFNCFQSYLAQIGNNKQMHKEPPGGFEISICCPFHIYVMNLSFDEEEILVLW